jgi:hypothetical protein
MATENRAFKSVRQKGRDARLFGWPESHNPYKQDWRTYRGSVTFSRAFYRAWNYGWNEVYGPPACFCYGGNLICSPDCYHP